VQRTLSAPARAGLAVLWMSPLVCVPAIGGIAAAVTRISWGLCLLVVYALMIGLCYAGWLWVERWVLPHGAERRAVLRTVVVVLIQLASAAIIVGVLYWAATR